MQKKRSIEYASRTDDFQPDPYKQTWRWQRVMCQLPDGSEWYEC